ncbi:MAG: hypothetical protein AAGE94_09700 [Acidobacteriota bacterium]
MPVDLQHFEDAVVQRLGPLLGETMARAALAGHCRSLGLESDILAGDEIETVLRRLGQGMVLFVGAERAERLTGQLREDLHAGGAS